MAKVAEFDNRYSQGVAEFVSGLNYKDVPTFAIERIKLLILDSIGCGIYGAGLPWTEILKKTLGGIDSSDSCSLLGSHEKFSAPHAALVNGTQIQGFELDDVHRNGVLHVGAVTLPPLFAITEGRSDISGKDFLTAAVAGYEVGPRVGLCMGQEHIGQGWHSGATLGVFSAASGAARLLNLSEVQTVNALGIAGTQSSGSTFSRSHDRYNLDALTDGLGSDFEIMRVALKFYSCVGSNHTSLDAIKHIQTRRPFGVDDFEKIVIHGSQVTVDHVGWPYQPQGLTSAQLNLPFCVATFLLEGDVFVKQFTPDCVDNEARIDLSRRVEVIHDPEITALGAKFRHKVRVDVYFKNGAIESETREAPIGSEHSFGSESDIVGKFLKLTEGIINSTTQDEVVETMLNLENINDASKLVKLITGQ
jgi:aconitate decarboxylase